MLLALSPSDVVSIMLINVKVPTIVDILTFMSRINFMLSRVEHEKSFIISGPDEYRFADSLMIFLDSLPTSDYCRLL